MAVSQHRQVRIKISDRAWALVSARAATRHVDRGQLIDEIVLAFFDAVPAQLAEPTPDGQPTLLPKPPAEPADAGLPFTPVPKPNAKRSRG